jgi:hypothetical protein
MAPVVVSSEDAEDRRKGKTLLWREAKITLAHLLGSVTPFSAGCIEGGVEAAGRGLLHAAVLAGFGSVSTARGLGDGAPWIPAQVEDKFGAQGFYAVDFFHVREYPAAAAKAIVADEKTRKAWMEARKEELKTGRLDAVLAALSPRLEPDGTPNDEAPVRACHRYLTDRADQLDYAGGDQGRTVDRLGRDRERPSLRRAEAAQAVGRLVAGQERRTHDRAADHAAERRMGQILDGPQDRAARTRQFQQPRAGTGGKKGTQREYQIRIAPNLLGLILAKNGVIMDRRIILSYEKKRCPVPSSASSPSSSPSSSPPRPPPRSTPTSPPPC